MPEVLAYHLTEAGAFPEAVVAWLRAGVAAARRSAHVEAVEHIRNGLSLLGKVPDLGSRQQFELNLQASLMGSLLATLSATSSELAACCERGLQLCEECAAAPMVFPFAFGQFTFVNCRGRTSEAIALARQFISRAEHGGFESERVIGHRMLGQSLLAKRRRRGGEGGTRTVARPCMSPSETPRLPTCTGRTLRSIRSLSSASPICAWETWMPRLKQASTRCGRPTRPASALDGDPDALCRRLGIWAVRGCRADADGGEKPPRAGGAASTVRVSCTRGCHHRMGTLPARTYWKREFP